MQLGHFQSVYTDLVKEELFRPLEQIPCTWIDTEEELHALVPVLAVAPIFAIDLEHHDMHSYLGPLQTPPPSPFLSFVTFLPT